MRPKDLEQFLEFSINNKFPILIKGKPGVGKSTIAENVCNKMGVDLIITHPVVSDPTDYKGLPFASNGKADFLPFGDLESLMTATKPTAYFIDDLGQAPSAVQAAIMQLLLARQINGKKISDEVTFIAATNRKEDKAAVSGLLEPVKSRFASIVELEVNSQDWIMWALNNNMPIELISFIRFKPEILDSFAPSKDLVNTPTPRTVTSVGKLQNASLPADMEFEAFKGAAGEAFAVEYCAFLKIYRDLPSVDDILLAPSTTAIPEEVATKHALCGALSAVANDQTIEPILIYMDRVGEEFTVACIHDSTIRNPKVTKTSAFVKWSIKNASVMFNVN